MMGLCERTSRAEGGVCRICCYLLSLSELELCFLRISVHNRISALSYDDDDDAQTVLRLFELTAKSFAFSFLFLELPIFDYDRLRISDIVKIRRRQ